MSRWVIDAALSLSWYLKDELNRTYSLDVLSGLVENGLAMAHRSKRIGTEDLTDIVRSLRSLAITVDRPVPTRFWSCQS